MSSIRIILGTLICFAALFTSAMLSLVLGGIVRCSGNLSPGLVGGSVVVPAVFGGTMAFVWPKAWWAGALAFSVPGLAGATLLATLGEWPRAFAISLGIVGALVTAFIVRYPGRASLKS